MSPFYLNFHPFGSASLELVRNLAEHGTVRRCDKCEHLNFVCLESHHCKGHGWLEPPGDTVFWLSDNSYTLHSTFPLYSLQSSVYSLQLGSVYFKFSVYCEQFKPHRTSLYFQRIGPWPILS